MAAPDLLYLSLIAALMLVDRFVLWPAFLRRSQANPARARLWVWSSTIIMLWTMAAAGIALWLFEARAWESLGFVVPRGWRMWAAIGLALAIVYAHARPVAKLMRRDRPKRVKLGWPGAEMFAPHTDAELAWWMGVSLTAGFCEELVFRGYLIWVFQPMLGLWGAAALSVVAFALGHAYQGAKGIVSTGIVGAIFTLIFLVLGSLLPAIALHALMDV